MIYGIGFLMTIKVPFKQFGNKKRKACHLKFSENIAVSGHMIHPNKSPMLEDFPS